jgi:hypothetical protein
MSVDINPGPFGCDRRRTDWGLCLGRAFADGVEDASGDDEQEVVEVEILNHERGEVVGTIDMDGNLDTGSEALRNVSRMYG